MRSINCLLPSSSSPPAWRVDKGRSTLVGRVASGEAAFEGAMPVEPRSQRRILFWSFVAAAILIGVLPLIPPSVTDSPGGFSTTKVIGHAERIATDPHPMGSAANVAVRAYLLAELDRIGLETQEQPIEVQDYFGPPGDTVEIVNVMARLPGTGHTGSAVTLVAHYDSHPNTPGANDNAANVGILLEVARVLTERLPLHADVIVLFTDAEEPSPRPGAKAFTAHPWFEDVGFVVNLETNGSTGPSLLAETSGPEANLIEYLADGTERPASFSFITEVSRLIGEIGTDFDVFEANGIPGVHFAYTHGSPVYHTPADSVESLGRRSIEHQGQSVLSLVNEVGGHEFPAFEEPAVLVFASVADRRVVSYPAAWSGVLSLTAAGIVAVALVIGARRQRLGGSSVLAGFAGALGVVLLISIVATVGWIAIAGWRFDLGPVEAYAWLLALGSLAAISWVLAARRWPSIAPGLAAVWGLMGLATGFAAPGASYLFIWPALAMAVILLVNGEGLVAAAVRGFGTAVSIILVLPAIDVFFQFAQPRPGNPDSNLAGAVVVSILILVMTVGLVERARRQA